MIEQLGHDQAGRRGRPHSGKKRFDLIHDVDRGSAAVFQNGKERGRIAILANDIRLDGKTVSNMRHVPDVNHRAVYLLDRDVVQRGDSVGVAVDIDDELALADFRRASRQGEILRVDCVAHIERRETFR